MNEKIVEIIKNALAEDIGSGDITTIASIPDVLKGSGEFLAKQNGVISGLEVAEKVFKVLDPDLSFKAFIKNGDKVNPGKKIAVVEGKVQSILTAERTALNFLQRMSGIATLASAYSEKIKHTKAEIIDTRKTVPGLRILDKLAVKSAGCENHRIGLFDMFLIKDNHIAAAGSISKTIEACRDYQKKNNKKFKIEVEVKNLDEVKEAIEAKADIIMLDNFNIDEMKNAVQLINRKSKIEASGMVNLDTVKEIAETGVDYISVGALTHSVKALDISLEIKSKVKAAK